MENGSILSTSKYRLMLQLANYFEKKISLLLEIFP